MTKQTNSRSKLGWVVGGIWIVVILLAGGIWLLMDNFSAGAALSEADAGAPVQDALSAAPMDTPTATLTGEPLAADMPTATLAAQLPDATNTPALIPTKTFGPTPTPIDFPTMMPTNEALWEGPLTIGYSVEGRPLEMWRFGRGENKYLVVAGIHGGYEINTIQLADQLIAYFSQKPDAVPANATLYILRSMNPDGETKPYKKVGRGNANDVDLNRSFPVEWSATWDHTGCWDYLELNAGQHPASEPETIAVMAFMLETPVIAVVSYHSAAPGFYPAGDPLDPNSDALATYLSQVSGYPYPAVVTGCYMTGALVDWALTTGAAGVDVELTDHWETEFNVNLNLVLALLRWEPE
ncbi:hypothetical protein KQH61_04620 [bacterium]|nr:hypothetical protein [bacterium]MCB2179188.1 hypothetical protein [bacterium]